MRGNWGAHRARFVEEDNKFELFGIELNEDANPWGYYWLASGFRQARRFDGVLSTVCLPPYADPVSGTITRTRSSGHVERRRQLGANAEWPLRARPHGQLAVGPLGDPARGSSGTCAM